MNLHVCRAGLAPKRGKWISTPCMMFLNENLCLISKLVQRPPWHFLQLPASPGFPSPLCASEGWQKTLRETERSLLTCQGWRSATLEANPTCSCKDTHTGMVMAMQTWVHHTSKHSGEHVVFFDYNPMCDHKWSCCCFLGRQNGTTQGEMPRIVPGRFLPDTVKFLDECRENI